MTDLLLNLWLLASLVAPFAPQSNHPPIARADQRVVLYYPAAIVDLAVLENDMDADGDSLQVIGLSSVQGGKAEVVNGALVRVVPDWSRVSGGGLEHLVSQGTYLVSDGAAVRQARWTVWYWAVMQP